MPESYLYAIPDLLYLGVEWADTRTSPLDPNSKDISKLKSLGPFLNRKRKEVFGTEEKRTSVQFAVFLRLQQQLRIQQQKLKKKEIESLQNVGAYLPGKIKEMLYWYGRFEPRLKRLVDFDSFDRVERARFNQQIVPRSFSNTLSQIQRPHSQGMNMWNEPNLNHQPFRGYSQPNLLNVNGNRGDDMDQDEAPQQHDSNRICSQPIMEVPRSYSNLQMNALSQPSPFSMGQIQR